MEWLVYEFLWITDNEIGNEGIESLCETLKINSTLTKLDLSGELRDISINEYKQWISMIMTGNKGCNEGAKTLGEMLHENKSLKTLYYRRQKKWGERQKMTIHIERTGTSFGLEGAKSLSKGLKTNTSLTELDIQCKHIDKHCFWDWNHTSTWTVSDIGDKPVIELSKMLMKNTTLQTLDLYSQERLIV